VSDRYSRSFGSFAETYERARPTYADEALAWIVERLPFEHVLDLAAGTGKLSRQLVARSAQVVAVEPDAEMRAVFARVLPDVDLLAGEAESIPLPDAAVDTVAVGQAFHWFRHDEALPEIHRVLRPGGGVALLWNEWDDDNPLLHALNEIVEALRPPFDEESSSVLETSPLFRGREELTFRHSERLPAEIVVARVSSVSAIAAADAPDRERALAEVRSLVGEGTIHFPMITTVVVADRA
jgi:ubiquinone/menaquinone biosynthesis C-methylase UbiE